EGSHELAISVAGIPIAGSPFSIPVLDPSAVRVIGLRNDRVGVEQQFNVDYINSGALSASVEIRCGSNSVPCGVKRVKPGLLMCSFTPVVPGLYSVDVHIDGLVLPDPNGGPLPVRCYRQQDDSYWVEFTPEQTGTHNIEVTFGEVPVVGSPFKCEVVDPKKVRVKGLSDAVLLRHATVINVDRRQAGTGDLSVEVSDPSGTPLKVEMLKSPGGEDRATFLPNQTGPHKINVKVAGFQIPGKQLVARLRCIALFCR
ncbi:Filamin/ABP280 repeat protein, partial [Oesophagostomum dentatum]